MKKIKQKQQLSPQKKKDSDNYEVASMMRRMSPYRNHRHPSQRIDTDSIDKPNYKTRTISSNDEFSVERTGTASFEYLRLEDQLSDYNTRNESAHENLRRDYEQKINNISSELKDKLSMSLFKWIIGGLVTAVTIIVTIWITFSYNPLIEEVEKTSEDMRPIEKKVNQIDFKIEHIQNEMDELKMLKTKVK